MPPLPVRLHSLNIIFNLCVHINMVEEMHITHVVGQESTDQGESGDSKRPVRTLQLLSHIQKVLLALMEQACIHQEKESKVLDWMLKIYFFIFSRKATLSKEAVLQLDPRFLPLCLSRIGFGARNPLWRILCCMLTNYVIRSNKALSQMRLNTIGGLHVIVANYLTTQSMEARDNFFVVLYDCVVHSLLGDRVIESTSAHDQEQMRFLIRLFRSADLSQNMVHVFRHLPPQFVEEMEVFFTEQHAMLLQCREKKYPIPSQLDTNILRCMLRGFAQLALKYQEVELPYKQLQLSIHDSRQPTSWAIILKRLAFMLMSETLDVWRSAVHLVFEIRYAIYCNTLPSLTAESHQDIQSFCSTQLSSSLSEVRCRFLESTYRLLCAISCRKQSAAEGDSEPINTMCSIFTEDTEKVLSVPETGVPELVRVLDMLFFLLVKQSRHSSQDPAIREVFGEQDTVYHLFTLGKCSISLLVLAVISIDLLRSLFQRLSSKVHGIEKVAVLILIMKKCAMSKDTMKSVGLSYFRHLLYSRHAEICYLASQFLMDQLKVQKPGEYKEIIARILGQAQKTNDVALLSNPFLQIRSILDKSFSA